MVKTVEDVEFEIETLHAQVDELDKKIAKQSAITKKLEAEIDELINKRCAAMGKLVALGFEATIAGIMAGGDAV